MVIMIKIATLICAYEFRNVLQDIRLITIEPCKTIAICPTFESFNINVVLILQIH